MNHPIPALNQYASPLPSNLVDQVLRYLGCERKLPSVRYLNQLSQAYIRRVPWESVSRLIKRQQTPQTAACPRWPEEFWRAALDWGTGGTCFENNLAFFTLLSALGFEGYLTINNMQQTPACHTAILILLEHKKYLVDVAIPLHTALLVRADQITRRATPFHHYTVRPSGENVYEIERSHHPKRNIYTLLDRPVPPDAYRAAVAHDYEPGGFFLDRVILVMVIADRLWRFNSLEKPYKLEGFDKSTRQVILLEPESMARVIAEKFGIAEEMVAEALGYLLT